MCAYNPGVQDVSGQFLAQGIEQAGQSLARGIKEFRANQAMTKQAVGKFAGVLQQDPDLLKLFESGRAQQDAQAAYEKFKGNGKVNLKDAAMLATMADTFMETKKQRQQMAMQQQQQALVEQQTAALKAEQENLMRSREALRMATSPQSPMGSAIQGGAKFQELPPGMSTTPQAPDVQEMWRRFGQSGAPITPEAARFFETQAQMQAMQARATQPRAPVKAIDPYPIRTVDEKGQIVEQTIDRFTGKTLAKPGPIQKPPSTPDPLLNSMYQDFSKERQERVLPALSSLQAYNEIDKILNSDAGKISSGVFANAELLAKRVGTVFGMSGVDVKNTETMRSLFAVPVAQVIRNFGAGTGLSDADREYAAKAAGGDITLNAESIKELVRIGKEAASNIQAQYEERLDSAFPDDADNPAFKQVRRALLLPQGRAVTRPSVGTLLSPAASNTKPNAGTAGWDSEKEKRLQELKAKLGK